MAKINRVVAINTTENPTGAQDKIMAGLNFLADGIKQTLGPYGRNFLLEKGLKITNDGLNIAKEMVLEDEIENLALRVTRESAIKTADEAGDGTSTALTFVQSISKELLPLLPGKTIAGKKSAMAIRKQVNEEREYVLGELTDMARPIKSKKELIEVARVSVEDTKLAELIGGTQYDLGGNGVLLAEETNDTEDSVEHINGVRFDNGFGTSMVMNNEEKQRLEVEDVQVIMTNYTFEDLNSIKPVLEELVTAGNHNIVIIGRAFTDNAIKLCMENAKSGVHLYPINAPYVNQSEIMRDLASVLGGTYFDQEETAIESMTTNDVGLAKRVYAYRFSAIFTGEKGEDADKRVKLRIAKLKKSFEGEESIFMKKGLEERIAQLTNGFAIVKVGALSDIDRKYKFDKAEDAVSAVRSALQEGTVAGGGVAFKEISVKMKNDAILKRALLAPYLQIQANAGESFKIESWVRNSVKVERVALQNACQIALDLATACGAIADENPKPKYVSVEENQENAPA